MLPVVTLAPSAGVVVMAPWAVGSSPLPHSKAGASPDCLARHSPLVTRHCSSVVLLVTRPWPLATFHSSLFTIHSSVFLLVTCHCSWCFSLSKGDDPQTCKQVCTSPIRTSGCSCESVDKHEAGANSSNPVSGQRSVRQIIERLLSVKTIRELSRSGSNLGTSSANSRAVDYKAECHNGGKTSRIRGCQAPDLPFHNGKPLALWKQ